MKDLPTYSNPLIDRYSSKDMVAIFSPPNRYGTWRRLWLGLAREEKKLGLNISDGQLKELEENVDNIDFDQVSAYEKELRHDVMAHVKAYGEVAPSAAGIIHLGATSCFITDNADLILHRQACNLLISKAQTLLLALKDYCAEYSKIPCLGFTHFQPAQLTTVGKRGTLWAQDILMDLTDLVEYVQRLPMRGVKGTTGTQASFLELFDGDYQKVLSLDSNLAESFGFSKVIPVSGQTYTRKLDEKLLSILSGFGSSSAKFANDLRLLMHLREVEEPFGKSQIGSSAMAYKRNPMRSERISSLSRFLQAQQSILTQTVSTQWLERTLDDSACRRLAMPESFMALDAILKIYHDIISGAEVYPERIRARVKSELPFMSTEKIIMECVKKGADRQDIHESIRSHSMEVRMKMDREGVSNDLIERLKADPVFENIKNDIDSWMDPMRFTGAASMQTDAFIKEHIEPSLQKFSKVVKPISFEKVNV